MGVETDLRVGVFILVKEYSPELEVTWQSADIDHIHLIDFANDDVSDNGRVAARVTCLIKSNVQLLKPESVFTAHSVALTDLERLELAIFDFEDGLKDVDT